MKKFLIVIMFLIMSITMVGCVSKSESVVRIHIRANSNDVVDQEIKLSVRDDVIEFITPLIAECENSEDVKLILSENISSIENIANNVLTQNGFNYFSKAQIRNEYFPTREYGGNTFPADYYDALIIELGSGEGDNWWCVAYPPLCFVGNDVVGENIKYKSKLLELINRYWG